MNIDSDILQKANSRIPLPHLPIDSMLKGRELSDFKILASSSMPVRRSARSKSPNDSFFNDEPEKPAKEISANLINSIKPVNSMGKKMSLSSSRGMNLGRNGFTQRGTKNHGFPTKLPEIKPDTANLPMTEFHVLEERINQMKNNIHAVPKFGHEINDSKQKESCELLKYESQLTDEVYQIKMNIETVIKDRSNLQNEHKEWLEKQRKRIVQARNYTNCLKNGGNVINC